MDTREDLGSVSPALACAPMSGIGDALTVRKLRNSCARYLTNNRNQIGIVEQVYWYFRHYRKLQRSSDFRIFLFRDSNRRPVGYGALKRHGGDLLVTECVREGERGRGIGGAILAALIDIASREQCAVGAEIWADNRASISLHERAGFQLVESRSREGRELRTYARAGGAR